MYIWTAIDVDSQLKKQKELVKSIEDNIKFTQSNVSLLPLHISLKISAEVEEKDEDNLRKDIISLFESSTIFNVSVNKIEKNGNIIWIKMEENENLRYLHSELCNICCKYGIELHEFDKCFAYHTTLFLDSDQNKIDEAYDLIKGIDIPKELQANTFIIGSSPSGLIGTYKVDKKIELSEN